MCIFLTLNAITCVPAMTNIQTLNMCWLLVIKRVWFFTIRSAETERSEVNASTLCHKYTITTS